MSMLTGAMKTQTYADADAAKVQGAPSLGSVAFGEKGKVYKFVQYDAATAAVAGVAGEACYYVAATGYAANTVTSDLSDSDEVGAGILQADMADGALGWIQIKGQATLSIAFSAVTDGAPMTPTGGADGTLDVAGLATDHICGVAGDASAKELLCDFPW